MQIATLTGTTITNSGLIAGTSYSYRVKAADAAGKLSAYPNTATAKPALATHVHWEPGCSCSGDVDLTEHWFERRGLLAWIHPEREWRRADCQHRHARRRSGPYVFGDNRTMTWRNGKPTPAGTSSSAVLVLGSGNGLQFTVPADTTTRTLIVYVRVQNGTGTLTAHLSDGSATYYVKATALQPRG